MLVWVAVLLQVIALASATSDNVSPATTVPFDAGNSLQDICNNATMVLKRISHMQAIIDHLERAESSSISCSDELRDSIVKMRPVIEPSEDTCSLHKARLIRDFHLKYSRKLPPPLKNFFHAYALIVSNKCRKNMVDSLLPEAGKLITADELSAIANFTSNKHSLSMKMVSRLYDTDDILLSSLVHLKANDTRVRVDASSQFLVKSQTGQVIERLQSKCRRKFKPIYDKMVLPLATLSSVGYSYTSKQTKRALKSSTTKRQVSLWSRITFMCESLASIEIVENADCPDGGLVCVREGAHKDLAAPEEAIVFSPHNIVSSPDDLLIRSDTDNTFDAEDRRLAKLVKRFEEDNGVMNRVRVKLMRKLAKMMKSSMERGKFKVGHSFLGGADKEKLNSTEVAARNELIRSLDDYIYRLSKASSIDDLVGNGLSSKAEALLLIWVCLMALAILAVGLYAVVLAIGAL